MPEPTSDGPLIFPNLGTVARTSTLSIDEEDDIEFSEEILTFLGSRRLVLYG